MTDVNWGSVDPRYTDDSYNAACKQVDELAQTGKTNGWCPDCKRYYTIVDEHTGETHYYATPQNEAQKMYRVSCISCINKQYQL